MIDGGDKGSVIVETTYKIVGFQPCVAREQAGAADLGTRKPGEAAQITDGKQPKDDHRFTTLENSHDAAQKADKGAQPS